MLNNHTQCDILTNHSNAKKPKKTINKNMDKKRIKAFKIVALWLTATLQKINTLLLIISSEIHKVISTNQKSITFEFGLVKFALYLQ